MHIKSVILLAGISLITSDISISLVIKDIAAAADYHDRMIIVWKK